jgi:hypothetical protein
MDAKQGLQVVENKKKDHHSCATTKTKKRTKAKA